MIIYNAKGDKSISILSLGQLTLLESVNVVPHPYEQYPLLAALQP
jgi:hypothetical protein